MEKQRFSPGCAARPWLMSISWVHPALPPWRGRAFLSQEPQQIIPSQSCDMLITLSGWWLELKQCSALMQAFIREQTKQGGWRSCRHRAGEREASTSGQAQEGRRWMLCSKSSHTCTFSLVLCWVMSWGAVGAISISGMRPGWVPQQHSGYCCADCTETLILPHRGAEPRQTPWLAQHWSFSFPFPLLLPNSLRNWWIKKWGRMTMPACVVSMT